MSKSGGKSAGRHHEVRRLGAIRSDNGPMLGGETAIRVVLIRVDANYGERYHKGASAAHLLKACAEQSVFLGSKASVEVVEVNACWRSGWDLTAKFLAEKCPDVIGFSCYCWNVEYIVQLSRLVRVLLEDVTIIVGGPEVTHDAPGFLDRYTMIDIVVKGEGEDTFCEILDHLMWNHGDLANIEGIAYRSGSRVVVTTERESLKTLDALPSPLLSGALELARIDGEVTLETVRGCPYSCKYCLYTKGCKGVRVFPWDRIEAEVRLLCGTDSVKTVWFGDPTFNFDEERAFRILDLVLECNPQLALGLELRAETMSDEFIDKLSEMNIADVGIGVQSINPVTLEILGRKTNVARLRERVAKLRCAFEGKDTRIDMDVIYGLPGDSFEDYAASVDFVIGLGAAVYYQPLRLFRGTDLFCEADPLGIVFDSHAPHNVLCCDSFSLEDMLRAHDLNAGLDFLYSGDVTMARAIHGIAEERGMSIPFVCCELGQFLRDRGETAYFRLSNATPNDIPVSWRQRDFLPWIKSIDWDSASMDVEWRESMVNTDCGQRSGYYHAAI